MSINQTFTDFVTPVPADWLNNVNNTVNYAPGFVGSVPYSLTAKIKDTVSVTDFGGPVGTDMQPAIAKAMTYLTSVGGGNLYIPRGNWTIGTANTSIPTNINLIGEGSGTILKMSVTGVMFHVTGANVTFSNMLLDGNNYQGTRCITHGQNYVSVIRCFIQKFQYGVYVEDNNALFQSMTIRDSFLINNTVNVFHQGNHINGVIDNCYIYGGDSVIYDFLNQHCEGMRITNSLLLPSALNTSPGRGIVINAGLEFEFNNTIVDQVQQYAVIISGLTAPSSVAMMKFNNCWFGFNVTPSATGVGTLIQGQVTQVVFRDCSWAVCPTYGVQIQNAAGYIPTNITFDGGFYLNNVTGDFVNNATAGTFIVENQYFAHATNPYQENNNNILTMLHHNTFPVKPVSISTSTKHGSNIGIVTINSGSGTIAGAGTSTTITHGLSYVPDASDITIVTTQSPTNNIGPVVITSVGATTFNVGVWGSPGATAWNFRWKANMDK